METQNKEVKEALKKIKFDFWYGNKFEDITSADVSFYPNEAIYRGNIYHMSNHMSKCIGDYYTYDSVALRKVFPGIFGE